MFIVIAYIVSYIKAQMSEMFIMHHMHDLYPPMHHMHGGTYLNGEREDQRGICMRYQSNYVLHKRYHKIEKERKKFKRKVEL